MLYLASFIPVLDQLPQPRDVALLVPNTHAKAIHAILRSGQENNNMNGKFRFVKLEKMRPRTKFWFCGTRCVLVVCAITEGGIASEETQSYLPGDKKI